MLNQCYYSNYNPTIKTDLKYSKIEECDDEIFKISQGISKGTTKHYDDNYKDYLAFINKTEKKRKIKISPFLKHAVGQLKICPTILSSEFFSQKNISQIQYLIKTQIKLKSGITIQTDQNVEDLLDKMCETYRDYSMNFPTHIQEQINKLNKILIDAIVPGAITNIKQYLHYIKDITQPVKTMDRPLNVSSKRQLPPQTTRFM
jgi:hypothetical protein